MIYTLNFYKKETKKKEEEKLAKRNLMSTLDIRDVLDGITKACLMKTHFYIWNLTWIIIWRVEETTNYCEVLRDLLFLLLFIYWCFMGSCAALQWFCMQIWIFTVLFHTYVSQFVLMYFYLYIPLCCMSHLLIFLSCSLSFVILSVSTVLVFMPCFQKFAFPFITPHWQKTP